MKKLEIERKYLIDLPPEALLREQAEEQWRVVQVYLRAAPGVTERVRQVTVGEETRYYHTEKRRISSLAAAEDERELTALEYMALFQRADTALRPIRKTRWRVPYAGRMLEIDVYPFWDDCAVLEVEVEQEDERPALPSWITVRADVTADFRFKNVSLAKELPPLDGAGKPLQS